MEPGDFDYDSDDFCLIPYTKFEELDLGSEEYGDLRSPDISSGVLWDNCEGDVTHVLTAPEAESEEVKEDIDPQGNVILLIHSSTSHKITHRFRVDSQVLATNSPIFKMLFRHHRISPEVGDAAATAERGPVEMILEENNLDAFETVLHIIHERTSGIEEVPKSEGVKSICIDAIAHVCHKYQFERWPSLNKWVPRWLDIMVRRYLSLEILTTGEFTVTVNEVPSSPIKSGKCSVFAFDQMNNAFMLLRMAYAFEDFVLFRAISRCIVLRGALNKDRQWATWEMDTTVEPPMPKERIVKTGHLPDHINERLKSEVMEHMLKLMHSRGVMRFLHAYLQPAQPEFAHQREWLCKHPNASEKAREACDSHYREQINKTLKSFFSAPTPASSWSAQSYNTVLQTVDYLENLTVPQFHFSHKSETLCCDCEGALKVEIAGRNLQGTTIFCNGCHRVFQPHAHSRARCDHHYSCDPMKLVVAEIRTVLAAFPGLDLEEWKSVTVENWVRDFRAAEMRFWQVVASGGTSIGFDEWDITGIIQSQLDLSRAVSLIGSTH
ncbi:hypothetical protein DFH27DRAFT_653171 [Peziza echinospora]|nr:hypothetical protein DFH27DRAFT_653171 [Peziza echinospora]